MFALPIVGKQSTATAPGALAATIAGRREAKREEAFCPEDPLLLAAAAASHALPRLVVPPVGKKRASELTGTGTVSRRAMAAGGTA